MVIQGIVNSNERNTMIAKNYAPGWGMFEAIKEIVQNQADGCSHNGTRNILPERMSELGEFNFYYANDTETKLVGSITVDSDFDSIRFENEGSLQTQALLMGGTDKANCKDAIGTHGEGSKLASLVLLRNNCSIRFSSGGKTWKYFLKSDSFFTDDKGEPIECLWVKIEDDPQAEENKGKVIVDIDGLKSSDWLEYTKKFLWLTPILQPGKIHTPHGTLLLDPVYEAQVFVKQIFTCEYPKQQKKLSTTGLYFGYDFDDIKLNRDRQGIENLDERHKRTSYILAWIVNNLNNHSLQEHLTAAQTERLKKEFLSLVYDSLFHCSHETYYFRDKVDKEGGKRIWNAWKRVNKDLLPENTQPVYPNVSHTNQIRKFISDHKLPEDLFSYTSTGISWQTWHAICRCEYYKTINQSYEEFVKGLQEAELNEVQQEKISTVLGKVNPCVKTPVVISIVHSDIPVSFINGNKLIVSSEVLQNTNIEHVLLAICLEKLQIDLISFSASLSW